MTLLHHQLILLDNIPQHLHILDWLTPETHLELVRMRNY
jgi:hypothetical protein